MTTIHRVVSRASRSVFVAIGMLCVSIAGQAQDPPKTPTKPAEDPKKSETPPSNNATKPPSMFTVVMLDPQQGHVSGTLPFGEPFILRTVYDKKTDKEIIVRLRAQETIGGDAFDCDANHEWDIEARALRKYISAVADTVTLVVPKLEPNVYYHMCVFKLSSPADDHLKAIGAGVREVFLSVVKANAQQLAEGFSLEQLRQVQRASIDRIRSRYPGNRIEIAPGSILDTGTVISPVKQRVIQDMASVTDKLKERETAIETATRTARNLAIRERDGLGRLNITAERRAALVASQSQLQSIPDRLARDLGRVWTSADVAAIEAYVNAAITTAMGFRDGQERSAIDNAGLPPKDDWDALLRQIRSIAAASEGLVPVIAQVADDAVVPWLDSSVYFASSTIADLLTRARNRIGLDVGIATAPRAGQAAPYAGANFYFTPVNSRAPLRGWALAQRLSLGIGFTTSTLQNSDRENVLSTSFVVNVGARIWDAFRISVGAVPYRLKLADPVRRKTVTRADLFVGVSVDQDIKDALGPIYRKLFPSDP